MGETRDACLGLVEKYQDRRLADRVFDLAWTHSAGDAAAAQCHRGRRATLWAAGQFDHLCQCLAARRPSVLIKNRRGQSGLWGYAISGDLPIVLLQIEDPDNIDLVRQLVQAHAYWRLKGLAVDLVIWNEDHAGYRQLLQEQIMGLIAAGTEANVIDRPGGIFVRPADQIVRAKTASCCKRSRASSSPTAGARWPNRSTGRSSAGSRACPRLDPDPDPQPEPAGRRRCPRATSSSSTGSADSRPMGASMSSPLRRASHAGALGQCPGQSPLRHRHLGERLVPTPGARMPTSSA